MFGTRGAEGTELCSATITRCGLLQNPTLERSPLPPFDTYFPTLLSYFAHSICFVRREAFHQPFKDRVIVKKKNPRGDNSFLCFFSDNEHERMNDKAGTFGTSHAKWTEVNEALRQWSTPTTFTT